MNETQTTVRGTIITDPVTRRVGTDQVFTFRVASNTRYQDRTTGEWKTGGTLYFSASCWGTLAQRTAGRLFKGDGILVQGRLLTNEYEKDGRVQRDLEMRVISIGPDMSRMDVTAKRIRFDPRDPEATGAGGTGEQVADGDPMEIGSVDAHEVDIDEAAAVLNALDAEEAGAGDDGSDAGSEPSDDDSDAASDAGRYVGAASA